MDDPRRRSQVLLGGTIVEELLAAEDQPSPDIVDIARIPVGPDVPITHAVLVFPVVSARADPGGYSDYFRHRCGLGVVESVPRWHFPISQRSHRDAFHQ